MPWSPKTDEYIAYNILIGLGMEQLVIASETENINLFWKYLNQTYSITETHIDNSKGANYNSFPMALPDTYSSNGELNLNAITTNDSQNICGRSNSVCVHVSIGTLGKCSARSNFCPTEQVDHGHAGEEDKLLEFTVVISPPIGHDTNHEI